MAPTLLEIKHILCPTDFSTFSERALVRATSLARWFGARITVMHSIQYLWPAPVAPGPLGAGYVSVPTDLLAEHRDDVNDELMRLKNTYSTEGVRIETMIAEGDAGANVEEAAKTLSADLIVMGTHGRRGWDRFIMGSTTERVMRRAPCPVLAVGENTEKAHGLLFRKILCPVELTNESTQTMKTALAFAEQNLAEVVFLHVLDGSRNEWPPVGLTGADREAFTKASHAGALQEMAHLSKGLETFCRVSHQASKGTAWREIVRVAQETHADLVVIGAHGANTLGPAFLGSTAAHVMQQAPCPVLLARAPKKKAASKAA